MPCDGLPEAGAPLVCEAGGGGLFLPDGADMGIPNEGRAVLYLIGLLYCFVGVAIIADIFMSAIEKITSKKVLVFDKKLNKRRTMTVWNPTVANLTLMALGSSAPEILLNVIGIFPTFQSSELGPSAIVGSAAFNLLCIIAVCVVSIPNGEIRKVKDMGVFSCTAFFSVAAYLWLLVILLGTSPDVVETWEGVLTFVFFWVLVVLAYLADAGKLPGTQKPPPPYTVHPETTTEEFAAMELEVRQKYGKTTNLTPEQVSSLIAYEFSGPQSRGTHRVAATRMMFGGKKVHTGSTVFEAGEKLCKELLHHKVLKEVNTIDMERPLVSFKALNYTVLESVGSVDISVVCLGPLKEKIKVNYASKDGTAKAGADYKPATGTLEFGPDKKEQTVTVQILHSTAFEHTEEFYVELTKADKDSAVDIGQFSKVTVVIIDEDHPGKFAFENEQLEMKPLQEDQEVAIKVLRKGGTSGKVSCAIRTENCSAVEGADFEAFSTTLEFEPGQRSAQTTLKLMACCKYESTESFRIILSDATGGAKFDNTTDGGDESCIMTVILLGDEEKKGYIQKLAGMVRVNKDATNLGHATYKEQFISAVFVNGSSEEQKNASVFDWVMHLVALPWKLLFAVVPPTDYCGGWLCFGVALGMVGLVTCLIGDMAELLGCSLDIPPGTTAITLVAVGTSLPDTFASKSAAQADPYADNSIGNVTGSNSVNVFLGLGLPWMISAIYWEFVAVCEAGDSWTRTYGDVALRYPKGIFVVKAGALATTVITFSCCAVVCIAVLVLRRKVIGGELGGPKIPAYLTSSFFVSLWVVYLVVSILLGDE